MFSQNCRFENEEPWFQKPRNLLCDTDIIPRSRHIGGKRINTVTRFIIAVGLMLWVAKNKYWAKFIVLGLILILIYHLYSKIQNNKSENYDLLSEHYYNNMSTRTANITNSYQGSTPTILRGNELGKRDIEAGITYYTPNSGVNRRTMVTPIDGPDIREIPNTTWGKQSTNLGPYINEEKTRDMTTNTLQQTPSGLPRARMSPSNQFSISSPGIGTPVKYINQTQGGILPMNRVGQDPDHGYYTNGTFLNSAMDSRDWNSQVLPDYASAAQRGEYPPRQPVMNQQYMQPARDEFPTFHPQKNVQYGGLTKLAKNPMELTEDDLIPTREGFAFPDESPLESSQRLAQKQETMNRLASQKLAKENNRPPSGLVDKFNNQGRVTEFKGTELNRVPPGIDSQYPTVPTQLMRASPVYAYDADYFNRPDSRIFLQDIQPKMYSYVVDQTPINSNIGITYAPQSPPAVMDQVYDSGGIYPMMSRVDPQLVRKDGTQGMKDVNPIRTNWSAEYSNFEPAPGSINFEDIYDPRYSSYGDPYRSYSDINLGQVQYYYSDIDAAALPNFISRTNIDYVDFRDPMGAEKPYYTRNASLDDVRPHVEDQTRADELFHREDQMNLLMTRANSRNWQLKHAPLRRSANGNSSYGPT
jgi:hypothetical protein